jgi:hypothetical protein
MFNTASNSNVDGHSITAVRSDTTKIMHRDQLSSLVVVGNCTQQSKYPQSYLPSMCSSSAPIKLPQTHIPRTRSELQIAQEEIKAELSDNRMYARLLHGMSQPYKDDEKTLHPLTAKSLMGIMNTHNRDYEQELEHQDALVEFPELNGWESSDHEAIISIDEASHKSSKASECMSIVSDYDDEDEDEYIFVLEM